LPTVSVAVLLLDVASIVKSPMRSLRKAGGRFRPNAIDGAGSRVFEVPLNG
jgi:hypothetical protein